MQPKRRIKTAITFACAAALAAAILAGGARTAEAALLPTTAAAIQEAFESIRESLADLITAKDEQRIDELRFRINAYRDILRYTATDIQDLRIQLGANASDAPSAGLSSTSTASGTPPTAETAWLENITVELADAARFIDREQVWLNSEEGVLSLDGIRSRAESFQEWRDTEYRAAADPAHEFLLVERQASVIDTASRRLAKIGEDIARLRRARVRGAADLGKPLAQATTLIREAMTLEAAAQERFAAEYFAVPNVATTTTSTAPLAQPVGATSTATSTGNGSSTLPLAPPPPEPKELVRQSLEKIQSAYRLFLDMSNAVQAMLH